MKTKKINMYVVVSMQNKPELFTMREHKKDSIRTFENMRESTWKNALKYGWRCIKIDVIISTTKNY